MPDLIWLATNEMSDEPHHSKIQLHFGRSASDYATSEVHARGESLDVLLETIDSQASWRVLDVATGAGHTAIAFAPRVHDVIACDITDAMLQETRRLAASRGITNVRTQVGDAECLPFRDSSFDLVTCRLAFHHFQKPQQALSEFARVLKPGGWLGFTDNYTVEDSVAAQYYNEFEQLRDPSHHWVGGLSEIQSQISQAGFAIRGSQRLSKEFEFHQWADRQRVNDEDKRRLMQMMRAIPPALRPHFQPRFDDETLYFHLWEVAIVGNRVDDQAKA